jgi:type IV pilus assembly protein PilA
VPNPLPQYSNQGGHSPPLVKGAESMIKSLLERAREVRSAELGDGDGLEEGFTLIELMVVLLIIAILLAIAIPTFLGVTNSASDRAAQSNLTNGLTEAKAIFQNNSSYYPAGGNSASALANFTASAPEFKWQDGTAVCSVNNCMSEQTVDVAGADDGNGVALADYSSKDATCWYALDLESTPVGVTGSTSPNIAFTATTGTPASAAHAGVFYAKSSGSTNCSGNYAVTHSGFKWGDSYAAAPTN